jgi:putative proteasome-type protease
VINRRASLIDATKCTMVSFDSTMRSNISVGLPIDLVVYETDSLRVGMQRRIDEDDPYYQMVHRQWGEGCARCSRSCRIPIGCDGSFALASGMNGP